MQFLTEQQLNKLPTPRLYSLFKMVRQRIHSVEASWRRWGDYTSSATEYKQYKNVIKSILDTREHIDG